MNKIFVERFMNNKNTLRDWFKSKHPESYKDIVCKVVENITSDDYEDIDPSRIHEIDDGDYQGTLLYIIGANNYQPDKYWFVKVDYGSCSGCDTLAAIRDSWDYNKSPTEQQVEDYMILALHIVQGIKLLGGEES